MYTKLVLDTDIIAIESEDKVTLMVDLTAPDAENQASRPARGVQTSRTSLRMKMKRSKALLGARYLVTQK